MQGGPTHQSGSLLTLLPREGVGDTANILQLNKRKGCVWWGGALPFKVLRIKQDSSWKFCTI